MSLANEGLRSARRNAAYNFYRPNCIDLDGNRLETEPSADLEEGYRPRPQASLGDDENVATPHLETPEEASFDHIVAPPTRRGGFTRAQRWTNIEQIGEAPSSFDDQFFEPEEITSRRPRRLTR